MTRRSLQPLGHRERRLVVLLCACKVPLVHVDKTEIVQDRRIRRGLCRADLFQDRHRAAVDGLGRVEIARVGTEQSLRPETRREPGVLGAERALDELHRRPQQRFGLRTVPRVVQQDRDSHPRHRRIRVAIAPCFVEDGERAALERLRPPVVTRFEGNANEIVKQHAGEHVIASAHGFADRHRAFEQRPRLVEPAGRRQSKRGGAQSPCFIQRAAGIGGGATGGQANGIRAGIDAVAG